MQEHRITAEQAPGVRGAHYAGDRPTPEQLDQLYNVQLLPSSEIARQYGGVTRKTVTNWLEQAGIPRRRGKAVIRFLPQSAFVPPEEREDCLLDRAWEARPERRISNKVVCRLCFQQVSRLTGKTAHLSTHHEGMSGDEYARLMPGHRHDCFQHTADSNGLEVEKLMDDWCTEWASADEIRHWRRDPKLAQGQEYIGCLECGRKLFGGAEIQQHTRKIHNWSLGQYLDRYPGAPTGSLERRAMQAKGSNKRWHELKQLRKLAKAEGISADSLDNLSPVSRIIVAKLRSSRGILNPALKRWLRDNGYKVPSDKTIQRLRRIAGRPLGPSGRPKLSTDNFRTGASKIVRTG